MATNIETMYVSDAAQLQATVQTLVGQGGVVQYQTETQAQIFLKKKLNVVVLVIGLILCLVPGLVYLLWYSTADQNQQITVQVGTPGTITTEHEHWYDKDAVDGASPGTLPPVRDEAEAQSPLPPAPEAYNPAPPAPTYQPTYDPNPSSTPTSDPPPPPAPPAG